MIPEKTEKVKLVAAVLYQNKEDLDEVFTLLEKTFSPIDHVGDFFPFDTTDYYEPEMGAHLQRGIISFTELVHPGFLAESKKITKGLEKKLSIDNKRKINIDIGYLDLFKVVLASYKVRSNKIYLSDGIWADMILYFDSGDYKTFSWGFPDFKSGIYNPAFGEIRTVYKLQLRKEKKAFNQ